MEEIEEIMDDEQRPDEHIRAFIDSSVYLIRRAFDDCRGYDKLLKILKLNAGSLSYIDIGTSSGNRLPKNRDYIALIEPGCGNLRSSDKDKNDILYAQEIIDFREHPLWAAHKIKIWHKILRQITTDLYIDDVIRLPYMTGDCTGIIITKI